MLNTDEKRESLSQRLSHGALFTVCYHLKHRRAAVSWRGESLQVFIQTADFTDRANWKRREEAAGEVFTFKESLHTHSPDGTTVHPWPEPLCLFMSKRLTTNMKRANSLKKFSLGCIFLRITCQSDQDKSVKVLGNLHLTAHKMPVKLKMRGRSAAGNHECPSLNVKLNFFPAGNYSYVTAATVPSEPPQVSLQYELATPSSTFRAAKKS